MAENGRAERIQSLRRDLWGGSLKPAALFLDTRRPCEALTYNEWFSEGKRFKMAAVVRKVTAFAAVVSLVLSMCGCESREREPLLSVFSVGVPLVYSGGEARSAEPCIVENGSLYLPTSALGDFFVEEDGGDAGRSAPSTVLLEGSEYVPLDGLKSISSLDVRIYGGLVAVSDGEASLDRETRAAVRELLGEPELPNTERTEVPDFIVDPYSEYGYDRLVGDVEALERAYPELITAYTVGETVEGRAIPAFTLGRGERVIFYGAAIHAGEHVTTNILMHMADRYARGYRADERLEGYISYRELLDSVTFYIIPQINPDGVNIAQNGFSASTLPVAGYDRQGVSWAGGYKANANGVDLNRNFPYNWNPMNENGITWRCMRYFCGFEATSEPETQAMIGMGESIPFEMFADFHKFGEELYWVDNHSEDHIERYGAIAERLLDELGFEDRGVEQIDHFGGYLSNYMRNTYDVLSMTIETCEYWSYGPEQFDILDEDVYRVGLIMGEELLKLPERTEGLRVEINGRTLPFEGALARDNRYISFERLCAILDSLGGEIALGEGTVTATLDGSSADAGIVSGLPEQIGADVFAAAGEGYVDVTELMSSLSAGAWLDGRTVRVMSFA